MTLEELLNKCIQRGWKPFGEDCIKEVNYVKHHGTLCWYFWGGSYQRWKSIRELVSKESGLWQFVCENGMVRKDRFTWMISPDPLGEDQYNYTDYRYRLIESALKNESELESFILDSIKIEG